MVTTLTDPGPLCSALSGEHEFIEQFWTLRELCRRYRCTPRYIRDLGRAGKFPKGRWVMGKTRFLKTTVAAVERDMLEGSAP